MSSSEHQHNTPPASTTIRTIHTEGGDYGERDIDKRIFHVEHYYEGPAESQMSSWLGQLGRQWWAILTVYASAFLASYGGIWFILDPMDVPETFMAYSLVFDRRVVHIISSFFLASHVTLALSLISARRKQKEEKIILRQMHEKLQQMHETSQQANKELETLKKEYVDLYRSYTNEREELIRKMSNLAEEHDQDMKESIRNNILKGLDTPSETLRSLVQMRNEFGSDYIRGYRTSEYWRSYYTEDIIALKEHNEQRNTGGTYYRLLALFILLCSISFYLSIPTLFTVARFIIAVIPFLVLMSFPFLIDWLEEKFKSFQKRR